MGRPEAAGVEHRTDASPRDRCPQHGTKEAAAQAAQRHASVPFRVPILCPMPPVFISMLTLLAAGIAVVVVLSRKRQNGLAAAAKRLGFAYVGRHAELESMLPDIARFGELAGKHGAWNAMRGVWKSTELVVFDHSMDEGKTLRVGGTATTALFLARGAELPDFEMIPQSLGTRIGAQLTGGDVDLPDAPWLDARISLRGRPREAVRAYLSGDRARALRRLPLRLSVRSGGGWLAIARQNELVPLDQLEGFLDEATALAAVLLTPMASERRGATAEPPPPPPQEG